MTFVCQLSSSASGCAQIMHLNLWEQASESLKASEEELGKVRLLPPEARERMLPGSILMPLSSLISMSAPTKGKGKARAEQNSSYDPFSPWSKPAKTKFYDDDRTGEESDGVLSQFSDEETKKPDDGGSRELVAGNAITKLREKLENIVQNDEKRTREIEEIKNEAVKSKANMDQRFAAASENTMRLTLKATQSTTNQMKKIKEDIQNEMKIEKTKQTKVMHKLAMSSDNPEMEAIFEAYMTAEGYNPLEDEDLDELMEKARTRTQQQTTTCKRNKTNETTPTPPTHRRERPTKVNNRRKNPSMEKTNRSRVQISPSSKKTSLPIVNRTPPTPKMHDPLAQTKPTKHSSNKIKMTKEVCQVNKHDTPPTTVKKEKQYQKTKAEKTIKNNAHTENNVHAHD